MEMKEGKDKIEFFYKAKQAVHIVTNENKYFNGVICDITETYFVIDDRYWGMTPLVYSEIRTAERYISKEEER